MRLTTLPAAAVTRSGRETRERIEGLTDALAAQAYDVLGADDVTQREPLVGVENVGAVKRRAVPRAARREHRSGDLDTDVLDGISEGLDERRQRLAATRAEVEDDGVGLHEAAA